MSYECWEGQFSPAPPCMKSSCCWDNCETSACCRALGRCGAAGDAKYVRANVMLVALFFSVASLIFLFVAVAGLSTEGAVVEDVAWVQAKAAFSNSSVSGNFECFIGIKALTVTGALTGATLPNGRSEVDVTVEWNDANCLGTVCEDCKSSATGTETVAIMSLITQLPQILTDLQRSTIAGDLNCQKGMAIATGIFGTVTTLASLLAFSEGCGKDLPDMLTIVTPLLGQTVIAVEEWKQGPGLVLIAIATVLKVIDVILHAYLAAPSYKTEDSYASYPPGRLEVILSSSASAKSATDVQLENA